MIEKRSPDKERKILLLSGQWTGMADDLRLWAQERGYGLEIADALKDALVLLHLEKTICVMIIEDNLEGGGLYEVIYTLKEMYKDLPIIVATDQNDPIKEKQIRLKGVFYYHIKSFGMKDLKQAIQSAMKKPSINNTKS